MLNSYVSWSDITSLNVPLLGDSYLFNCHNHLYRIQTIKAQIVGEM